MYFTPATNLSLSRTKFESNKSKFLPNNVTRDWDYPMAKLCSLAARLGLSPPFNPFILAVLGLEELGLLGTLP